MARKIEVAVLMPVYNHAEELPATLESLRAQSVPFKLFLVDDGSPIKADYEAMTKGMSVNIIRLPKNLGISGAMNAGIVEILKGDFAYIARIDNGDMCKPDRFAKQLAFLKANSEISVVGSMVEMRRRDGDGNLLAAYNWIVPTDPEAVRNRLYFNLSISHPAMMLRREVFEKLKAYSENYPAAEDYDLMWRTTKAGMKIANLAEVLLIKEERPGSISQKSRRRQLFSRLCLQWDNRDLTSYRSIGGILRSLAILAVPTWVINTIKKAKGSL